MSYSLCGTSVSNTGEQDCDKSRGKLGKLFIYNGTLEPADFVSNEAFVAALTAKAKLSKFDPEKVFVIKEAQDLADNSEANSEGTMGYGYKAVIKEGKPAYTIKSFAGSDLVKRYRTFNNQNVRLIEYDANGVFWVTKVGENAKGFQARLFSTGNKLATGANIEEGVVTIAVSIVSVSEYYDNAFWMEIGDGNVEDIAPLIDVNLTYISKATNVYKIGMKIPGSNLVGPYSIGSTYGTDIAALTFTSKTGATFGTSLAITSVAYDAALDALTVTFDNTAFGALPGGAKIKLIPPTPATLDGADVAETELISVVLTK